MTYQGWLLIAGQYRLPSPISYSPSVKVFRKFEKIRKNIWLSFVDFLWPHRKKPGRHSRSPSHGRIERNQSFNNNNSNNIGQSIRSSSVDCVVPNSVSLIGLRSGYRGLVKQQSASHILERAPKNYQRGDTSSLSRLKHHPKRRDNRQGSLEELIFHRKWHLYYHILCRSFLIICNCLFSNNIRLAFQ